MYGGLIGLVGMAVARAGSGAPEAEWSVAAAEAQQLLVVKTPAWDSVGGELTRYTWSGAAWQAGGAPIAVVVGIHGLGWGRGLHPQGLTGPTKQEGDGRAPAGVFRLDTAMGYAATAPEGATWPYRTSTADAVCVDDVASVVYNRLVDASTPKDWSSAEALKRPDALYRWLVVVGHNVDPTPSPGAGSCIFLHVWRSAGRGTAGCTAMAEADLVGLLGWLDPAAKPLLVQLPAEEYSMRQSSWGLP